MQRLRVEQLSEWQLAEAGPLVQLGAHPCRSWERDARALIARGGGVLGARAADGLLHGVATYEVIIGDEVERLLAVERLVSFELSGRQPVKRQLLEALARISQSFDCVAVVGDGLVSRADRNDDRGGRASPSR